MICSCAEPPCSGRDRRHGHARLGRVGVCWLSGAGLERWRRRVRPRSLIAPLTAEAVVMHPSLADRVACLPCSETLRVELPQQPVSRGQVTGPGMVCSCMTLQEYGANYPLLARRGTR